MLCSRVQNLLSAYCDRELSGAEMLPIQRHLSGCPICRQEHESLLQVKRLLGALPGAEPVRPLDLPALTTRAPGSLAWQRLARRFQAAFAAPCLAPPVSRHAPPASRLRRSGSPLALGGVAVFVAVLLGVLLQPQAPDAVTAQVPPALSVETELPQGLLAREGPAAPGMSALTPFARDAAFIGAPYTAASAFYYRGGRERDARPLLFLPDQHPWQIVESR